MSPIEAARSALALADNGALPVSRRPAGRWIHCDDLRAALAEVDRLTAERDAYRADLAGVSAECDLPPVLGPAPGEIRRWRLAALDCEATIDRVVADRMADARSEIKALRRTLDNLDGGAARVEEMTRDADDSAAEWFAVRAEVRRLRAQLAAYADLPPEPEPSPIAAFYAMLAIDNHPDDADGGGDCDGLR